MAFIRKLRSSRNRFSFQVLESYREHGKTRKRTLLCLGPHATLEAAIQDARCRRTYKRLAELIEFQAQHPQVR
jgi:hypothetical protein